MLVKTNIPGYMIDEKTRTVVHTDNSELTYYKALRDKIVKQQPLDNRVNKIEQDVNEIKNMIFQLLQKQEGK